MISEVFIIERSGKLIYHNTFNTQTVDYSASRSEAKKDLHLVSGAIVALADFAETVYNRHLDQLKFEDKMMHVAAMPHVVVCIVTNGQILSALFLANKYSNRIDKKLKNVGHVFELHKVRRYLSDDITELEKEIAELNEEITHITYV